MANQNKEAATEALDVEYLQKSEVIDRFCRVVDEYPGDKTIHLTLFTGDADGRIGFSVYTSSADA